MARFLMKKGGFQSLSGKEAEVLIITVGHKPKEPMRPLLRTTRSADALDSLVAAVEDFLAEDDTPYNDPFCGVAEAPFLLELRHCNLNDSNPHFINFYKTVKSGDFLKNNRWLISRGTDLNSWARNRTRFNELLTKGQTNTVEAAQLTFYLSHIGRNFRLGSTGTLISRNDPDAELPDIDWDAAAALMQDWTLSNHSEYNAFNVDADAPLVINAPQVYRLQWDGDAWDPATHGDLLAWLESRPGKVIVFHPPSRPIQELYAHWPENNRTFHLLPR